MDIFDIEGLQNSEARPSFTTPSLQDLISESSNPEGFQDNVGWDNSGLTVQSDEEIHLTVNPGDKAEPENLSHAVQTVEHHNKKTKKRKYTCSAKGCGLEYTTKGSRTTHMKTHTNDYKLFCSVRGCGRKFLNSNNLKNHVRVHTKEKPYICKDCEKRFTTSHKLNVHRRLHTGEMMKCDFEGCIKEFNTKSDLEKHNRTHTGERPFLCKVVGCGKRFMLSHHLKKHGQTHSSVKPFLCPDERCYEAFAGRQALNHHRSSKHKELQETDIEENNVHQEETNVSMEENPARGDENPCTYVLQMPDGQVSNLTSEEMNSEEDILIGDATPEAHAAPQGEVETHSSLPQEHDILKNPSGEATDNLFDAASANQLLSQINSDVAAVCQLLLQIDAKLQLLTEKQEQMHSEVESRFKQIENKIESLVVATSAKELITNLSNQDVHLRDAGIQRPFKKEPLDIFDHEIS